MYQTRVRWPLGLVLLVCLNASIGWAATLFPPGIRWWRLQTEHFDVYYPEGMESAAKRTAQWAEWAYGRLAEDFGYRPGRIRIILSDHGDFSSAFASIMPQRFVVVFLAPPASSETIGDYDDWLKMVLVHELTHVFHMERAHVLYRSLRSLLGRSPFLFPNLLAPDWFIEGLATLEETRWTRGGRACSAETFMMEAVARVTHTLPGIQEAWLSRAPWPGGLTPYHFGARFLAWVSAQAPESFWPAIRAKNEAFWPFFLNRREASHLVASFGRLWRRWQKAQAELDTRDEHPRANGRALQPSILTRRGYFVASLRSLGDEICYVNERAHEFPGVFCTHRRTGKTRRILEAVPTGSFTVDAQGRIIVSVLERRRTFWFRSDLLRVTPHTGDREWLGVNQRLKDPDVDVGGRIVAVQHEAGGVTQLILLGPRSAPQVLARSTTVRWSQPRWHPSHSTFVAVAHYNDGTWSIQQWTADGQLQAEWLRDAYRKMDPTWSPDGRWVLLIADYRQKLEVFALDTQTGQLFYWPIRGDGFRSPWLTEDTLWLAVYESDGFHIGYVPLLRVGSQDPSSSWTSMLVPFDPPEGQRGCISRPTLAMTNTPPPVAIRAIRQTSIHPVLKPFTWLPYAVWRNGQAHLGAILLGADTWGYSAYQVSFHYGLRDHLGRYNVVYRFDRWYPTIQLQARRTVTPLEQNTSLVRDLYGLSVHIPIRRMRDAWSMRLGLEYRPLWVAVQGSGLHNLGERWSLPFALVYSRALVHPYSVSPEDGWTFIGWGQWGFSGQRFLTFGGDVRWYAPGWKRHHVLALRITAAFSRGPEPEALTLGRESDDLGPLRALASSRLVQSGIVWNVEYRWPLFEIQRSLGLVPLFFERISGAVFYDGARYRGFRLSEVRTVHNVGVELRLHVAVSLFRVTLRAGYALQVGGLERTRRGYVTLFLPF